MQIKVPDWLDRIFAWPVMVYRKHKFGYSFRRIYLGEDEWTIVDSQDYYRLGHFKWCVCGDDEHFYAVRIIKKTVSGRIRTAYLHREITNAPKGLLVDHKNGDGLDNRRANLRFATYSQNACNRAKRKNALSKFFGVSYDKQRHRWMASIKTHGKTIYLGRFDDEADAAKAYDAAARKYHKEFAHLNFPSES